MCEIGLITSQEPTLFEEDLKNFFLHSKTSPNKDGWGIARYGSQESFLHFGRTLCSFKNPSMGSPTFPTPNGNNRLIHICKEPSDASMDTNCAMCCQLNIPANIHLLHIRQKSQGGAVRANTHPFYRNFNNFDWTFVHNGTVEYIGWKAPKKSFGSFQPLGYTDSEKIFCTLLHALNEAKEKGANINDLTVMSSVISEATVRICRGKIPGSLVTGTLNYILANGDYIFQFCNRENSLYRLENAENKVLKIFTSPPENERHKNWKHVELGTLNIYQQGSLLHSIEHLIRTDEIVKGDATGTDYLAVANN